MTAQKSLALTPGDILHLTAPNGLSASLLVEPQQQRSVLLALPHRPYDRLHVAAQKLPPMLSWKYTKGSATAMWHILEANATGAIHIIPGCVEAKHLFLALGKNGDWQLQEAECEWRLGGNDDALPACVPAPMPTVAHYSCSAADALACDGYCVLHELIPADKVNRALRFLNHHLGSADLADDIEPEGLGIHYLRHAAAAERSEQREQQHEEQSQPPLSPSDGRAAAGDAAASEAAAADSPPPLGVVKLGKGHSCTCCLAQAAPLLALLDESTRNAITSALDAPPSPPEQQLPPGQAEAPSPMRRLSGRFGMQVALRFPLAPFAPGVADGDAALPSLLEAAGLDWHTDAAKYNEKKTFDVVVGIFLSRVSKASDGALFVRPRSHTAEREARVLGRLAKGVLHSDGADVGSAFCGGGAQHDSSLDAALDSGLSDSGPSPTQPQPLARPIICEPGSVIVFDKDLLHAGGPNLSAGIRYALYARMRFEAAHVQ